MLKHVWVWEQANGRKLPEGHVVMFADRDKDNFSPDNLVAVPRSLMGVINSMHVGWHDRETLEAVVHMAELRVARNRALAAIERVCPCCGKRFDNMSRLRTGNVASTVCPECGKAGRKPPNDSGGRCRKYDHDKIRELYAMGYRNEQIADMIGCTRSTVSNAVNRTSEKRKAERWQRTS